MAQLGPRQTWCETRASRVRLLLAAVVTLAERGQTARALRVCWHAMELVPVDDEDLPDEVCSQDERIAQES